MEKQIIQLKHGDEIIISTFFYDLFIREGTYKIIAFYVNDDNLQTIIKYFSSKTLGAFLYHIEYLDNKYDVFLDSIEIKTLYGIRITFRFKENQYTDSSRR